MSQLSEREYIDGQVAAIREVLDLRDEIVRTAFIASDRAIQKAEVATDKRFESVNEFRAQLSEQAAHFATRESLQAAVKQLTLMAERNREDIAEYRADSVQLSSFETTSSEWRNWRQGVDKRQIEIGGQVMGRSGVDDLLHPINDAVAALQKWQFKIIGALLLTTVVLPVITAFAVYLLTRHAVPVSGVHP